MNPVVAKTEWEILGEELVKQYYHLFDNARDQLVALYSPDAMFSFEEHRVQGHAAIKEIVTEKLRFQKIQHVVTKVDSQPTAESGILVLVTGRLKRARARIVGYRFCIVGEMRLVEMIWNRGPKTDDDPPHGFSQTFYVKPFNSSFFIFHDIFRLSIHDG